MVKDRSDKAQTSDARNTASTGKKRNLSAEAERKILHKKLGDFAEYLGGAITLEGFSSIVDEVMDVIRRGRVDLFRIFIEHGYPINLKNEKGFTSLHMAAACRSRKVLREIMKQKSCVYYVRDNEGKLPSDMAYEWAKDVAVCRLLTIKEEKQRVEKGKVISGVFGKN